MEQKTKIENNMHASDDLKAWREGMGYSVEDACAKLGVAADDYTFWENGGAVPPRYVLLACAALALGIKSK